MAQQSTDEANEKLKEERKRREMKDKKEREQAKLLEEKRKVEETNAAVQISEETKMTEDKDKGKESEPVDAMPPSPVQQMTLPYMKRKEETEVENRIVEVEEAFSYFSTSSS